jgi:hypothetical protein|tara:strand:- start:584 stop:1531 length:948 start_codon:yes stop_codon:yes gene_type:complete
MNRFITLFIFLMGLLLSQEETAFIKYFNNDRDFLGDKPMLASERNTVKHIRVSYNEAKQPILKEWINTQGQPDKREIFSYDKEGKLLSRAILKKNNKPDKVITYGDSEPWGIEFRKYFYNDNVNIPYVDQRSEFQMSAENQIEQINFFTVDNRHYGSIAFAYDRLGFVTNEIWIKEPENQIVRRFKYQYDIIAQVKQIWEYDRTGNLISHQALKQAPADELYKKPPPRTGNALSEAGLIIEELRYSRMLAPNPAFIPVTLWDQLVTNNKDRFDIDFISVNENNVEFREPNGQDILSISLDRVASVVSRFGEIIYP